ncbi:MAG: 2-oxoglutarate dehydrogenase, E2 component, dihydrolipoamide succinyltransferase [Propionicimonas sp.]
MRRLPRSPRRLRPHRRPSPPRRPPPLLPRPLPPRPLPPPPPRRPPLPPPRLLPARPRRPSPPPHRQHRCRARRAAEEAPEAGYVTPLVRKMAESAGVDLASLTGTGVGGRIRKQDVLAAAEAKKAADEAARKAAEEAARAAASPAPQATQPAPAAPSSPAPSGDGTGKRGTTEKMTRIRATIAKRMVESLHVSAQLTATVEVDLTAISKLRAKEKDAFRAREGVGLSYLPFIAKAAVEALKQFPKVNATIDTEAGTITYADAEHLGVAVDTEKGLMVPVIKDAGDLSVTGLAKKIGDLASRSRSNKVTPDELSGGTFTITNYGSAGTLFDTPIINQPQVAILGTGALVKRPMVVRDPNLGEIIAVRDMMYLSMSYDHRLVDGADAARFLSFVKARLEEGDFDL